ncbi:cytochrome P450 family protein [Salinactinospora qingdaonensis]|uniref:Cytochrome P450 n=1 Tax=Salinactinospora qingdaonensis TaxID=702744 RepID=A0ABP7FE21_9ACTN
MSDTELRLGEELISPLHPVYDGVQVQQPPGPPYQAPDHPVWVVTRYRDAKTVLAHPDVRRDAEGAAELFTRKTGVHRPAIGAALTGHMLNADPPDHTRLRSLVGRAFTRRQVERCRPRIEQLTEELLDHMAAKGHADLMGDFSVPLTIAVICELIGVPEAERGHIRSSWERQAELLPPEQAEELAQEQAAYLRSLIAAKRRQPADDLLTALIEAGDAGEKLTDSELVAMVHLLLMAGFETTMNMIGNAAVTLLRHPDQLAAVRDDPELLPGALEELVRYDSPVCASMLRFTAAEVELDEVTIPAGEYVLVSNFAANHDPDRFDEPDRFDLTRKPEGHIGYGHGVHYCLGAPLARLEARIALGQLLRRFPDLTLGVPVEELQWLPITFLRALISLPVSLGTPALSAPDRA